MSTTLVGRGVGALRPALGVAVLAAIMWVSELADTVAGGFLDRFGIVPRTVSGLVGIPLAPLLHGGLGHLVANTGFFLVLGTMVALLTRRFWLVTVAVALIGGLGVWLAGRPAIHLGASGVIYGYAAFLISYGVASRRVLAVVLAIVVVLAYGGTVWGLLPGQAGVSWEGHLFGALAGVLVGVWLGVRARRRTA